MSAQPRSLEVRPFVRGDAPATLAAFLSAVTVTAAHDYSPEQVAAWSAPQERRVAEWNRARIGRGTIDGQIAGWATGSGDRDESVPARRELEGIYLVETAYGSGAGQLLLDAVVADAPAYLWMLDDNPRAEAFYRRNSFARDGVGRDKLRAGFPVHTVRMARHEHAMKPSE